MAEVLLAPWALPEQPERIKIVDDSSEPFEPGFGRGFTQVQVWGDPRWHLTRRYRGMRSDQRAAILSAINEARGKGVVVRATMHAPIRGSFPATELATNGTFENGTTGFTCSATVTLTSADRVARATRNQIGATALSVGLSSAATVTQFAPYVLRAMLMQGRGSFATGHRLHFGSSAAGADYLLGNLSTEFGLKSLAFVPYTTTTFAGVRDGSMTDQLAGDYIEVPYFSLTRCPLVDNGTNLLLQSDEFDTTWTATRSSVDDQAATGPDGNSTADSIIEDGTASNTHFVSQNVTVSSAVADYSFAVALKAGARTWAQIAILENTGGTQANVYVDLGNGALGTSAVSANFSDVRAFIRSMGDGWYYVAVVARKTNAATSLTARIALATGNGANSYSGDGTSNILAWRATLAQSSVPTRLVQTTTTASTGTSQSGAGLYVKGLPASTNGLLEVNDWFSFNGELKQVTKRLNSDASGLGYLQFRPSIVKAPADNDSVEILQPWGRFRLMNGAEYDNLAGLYADLSLELTESYTS